MEPAKFGAALLILLLLFVTVISPLTGAVVIIFGFPVWLLLFNMLREKDTDWHVPEQDWYSDGGHGKV